MASSKNEWKVTKSKIKEKFGKLSNADIDGLNGHLERLSVIVQKIYGYDKVKTESECKEFLAKLKNGKSR